MSLYEVKKSTQLGKEVFYIVNAETGIIEPMPSSYLKRKQYENKSPNTLRNIAFPIAYYMDYLHILDLTVEDVLGMNYEEQHEHFVGFLEHIKSGNHSGSLHIPSNNTCNTYLGAVFGYLNYLIMTRFQDHPLKVLIERDITYTNRVGVVLKHTVTHFSGRLKSEQHQYREMEESGVVQLLKASRCRRNILLMLLLLDTGMRIGELLGVNYVRDIDYDKRIIHVKARNKNENKARNKYGEDRDVYFSEETLNVMRLYIAENAALMADTEYLFINLHGATAGKAMNASGVNSMFRQLGKKTGIKATSHMFRHFFANERRKAGMDLLVIRDLLGHTHITTTTGYLHISSEEREKAEEEFHRLHDSVYTEDVHSDSNNMG